MKSLDFIKEDIVTDAQDAHVDHEVQMARSDCFHAAEDALTLHRMLRNIPETVGLEGWVAAKITLAADYLNTVREYLEYQMTTGDARPENADVVIVGESTEENPVANAITRRILMQRTDLLSKYGPGYVAQAIDEVADGVGIWDEIGTSDVSGWVRQVEWNLKNKLNQYDEPMDVGDALNESEDAKVYQDKRTGQYVAWIRDGKDNIIKGEGATPEEASAELQKMLAAQSQKVAQRTRPEADRRYSSWISNYIVRNLLQRGKDNSPVYALVKNGNLYASAKPVAGFKTANYDRQNEQGGGFQIWLTGKELSDAGLNASTRYLAKQIDDANGILVFSLTPHSTIVSSNDKVSLNHVPSLVIQHTGRNVVAEMSAGSVATVVNPPAKNKAKVGTLFGGTYQQKKVSKGKK